ncbi:MAG: hypothetical protein MRY21_04505 [Simkaniaceae bacterium]|nr:hypothetical protein [Simkaniaceae bacterium]
MATKQVSINLSPIDNAFHEVNAFIKKLDEREDLALALARLFDVVQNKYIAGDPSIYDRAAAKLRAMGLQIVSPHTVDLFVTRILNSATFGIAGERPEEGAALPEVIGRRFEHMIDLSVTLSLENQLFHAAREFVDLVKGLHGFLKSSPEGIFIKFKLDDPKEPLFPGRDDARRVTLLFDDDPATDSLLFRYGHAYREMISRGGISSSDLTKMQDLVDELVSLLKQRSLPIKIRISLRAMLYHVQYIDHMVDAVAMADQLNPILHGAKLALSATHLSYSPFLKELFSLIQSLPDDIGGFKLASVNMGFATRLEQVLARHTEKLTERTPKVITGVKQNVMRSCITGALKGLYPKVVMTEVRERLEQIQLIRGAEVLSLKLNAPQAVKLEPNHCKVVKQSRRVLAAIQMHTANDAFKRAAARVQSTFDRLLYPSALTADSSRIAPSRDDASAGAGGGGAGAAGRGPGSTPTEEARAGAGGAGAGAPAVEEEEAVEQVPFIQPKNFSDIHRELIIADRAVAESLNRNSVKLWQDDPERALKAWRVRNPDSTSSSDWLKAIHTFSPDHAAIAMLTSTKYALEWRVLDPKPGCSYYAIPAKKELPGRGECYGFIEVIMRDRELFHMVFQPEDASSRVQDTLISRKAFRAVDFPPLEGPGVPAPIEGAETKVDVDLLGTLHFKSGLKIYRAPSDMTEITSL